MTSRLIEACFDQEISEDPYISIKIDKNTLFILADPSMVNIKDLVNIKPGAPRIVRIRRPGWGKGDIERYIKIVNI